MRFRKVLLFLKVWHRLRQSRRREGRLRLKLAEQEKESSAKVVFLETFYQKQLATERKRFELLHTEWANRFLQKDGLAPVSLATVDLEEKVRPHLKNVEKVDDPANLLTFDQNIYFEDLKINFWTQGLDSGKSEAEINEYWESAVKSQAMEDARNAVGGLN